MASLIVQENGAPRTRPAVNGEEITIQAPCDCSAVTGVMIGSVVFPFYDACGNNVSGIDGKFGSGSLIRVMIDTINTRSYILNQASPVEKFHAAHHAAGGDDPITPTAIGAQNRLAWVTETGIDAMFSGTYSGEEDESAEASSAVLAAIADLQEQVGELEDEIREVAENVTGEPCDCSKYDVIASAESARQSAEAASQSAENARQNAIAAGGLATQAVASANLADQRATEAERYAAIAEQAIGKTSYIGDDGNWYEWDALQNDFTNTGVRARGGGIDLEGATKGQMIVVQSVDENGKPTEWDSIDLLREEGALYPTTYMEEPYVGSWEFVEELFSFNLPAPIVEGETYIVAINGKEYTVTAEPYELEFEDRVMVCESLVVNGAFKIIYRKEGLPYWDSYNCGFFYEWEDKTYNDMGFLKWKPATLSIWQGDKSFKINEKYLGSGTGIDLDSAAVGQMIMVKSVDENGKPTKWETIDLLTGGSGSAILPETLISDETVGGQWAIMLDGYRFNIPKPLVAGNTYKVIINGKEYTDTAAPYTYYPVDGETPAYGAIIMAEEYRLYYCKEGMDDDPRYNFAFWYEGCESNVKPGEDNGSWIPATLGIYEAYAEILPETYLTEEAVDGSYSLADGHLCFKLPNPLKNGITYTVAINGKEYTSTAIIARSEIVAKDVVKLAVKDVFDIEYGETSTMLWYAGCESNPGNEDSVWIPAAVSIRESEKHKVNSKYLDMDDIKISLPKVEMVATFADGTTATYKLYGEAVV